LTKHYGGIHAVQDLALHVPAGGVYGFLGPNGSGKTTTVRMLLGLARPTAGTVTVFGQPFKAGELASLRQMGALVESPSFYPHLTGRENLEIVRVLRSEVPMATQRVLELVGLAKDADRVVKHYSQGMRQRLGLGLALLGNPRLLILDEPTNALDPAGIHEMRELIRRLPSETGATLFVSSHMLSEVELIATHIGILNQGRLIFEGTPQQLREAYPEQILIRTDRPGDACALLRAQGWGASSSDHTVLVEAAGDAEANRIAQLFFHYGLAVFALQGYRPSLEDIFLSVTAAERQSGPVLFSQEELCYVG
jgi:ABC-2 type transport system ATP-binding protein